MRIKINFVGVNFVHAFHMSYHRFLCVVYDAFAKSMKTCALQKLALLHAVHCVSVCFVLGGPNKNGTVLEVKGWEGETDVS